MIKTVFSQKIVSFLKQDLVQNLNILGVIENMQDVEYYVDDVEAPKGVLVNRGYFNYIYTKEEGFIEDLIENYFKDDFYGFSGLSSFVTEKLKPHFTMQWESPCELYYLPEGALDLSLKKQDTVEVDIKDAQIIDAHYAYRGNGSLDRIKDDITRRPASAIYEDGEIACWVLVHQDNSMGIMYTMEQHRGKGYAVDVTIDLCDKLIKKGKTPFLQINVHNDMSPGLATKCGFVKYGRGNWFGGFKGIPKYFRERFEAIHSQVYSDFDDEEMYQKLVSGNQYVDYVVQTFGISEELYFDSSMTIQEVSYDSSESLEEWAKAATNKFSGDNDEIASILLQTVIGHKDNYMLFMAIKDDIPVSAGMIYYQHDEADGLCYSGCNMSDEHDEVGESVLLALLNYIKDTDRDTILYRAPLKFETLLSGLGAIKI